MEEAQKALASAALGPAKALPTAYFDVIVSCVTADPFGFSVQILDAKNNFGASLEKMMSDFSLFHRSASAKSPAGFSPKAGDLISGQVCFFYP